MDGILKIAGGIFLGLIALWIVGVIVNCLACSPARVRPPIAYEREYAPESTDECAPRYVGRRGGTEMYELSLGCK